MRDVLVTASITLLGAIGASCSAGAADEAARHVGTYEATGEGGDGALLEGTVRLVDGCLLVEQDDLGERYLVYFPDEEVTWSHDGLGYAESAYGAGAAIALPGGVSPDSRPVPSDCRERFGGLRQWIVAQSG